MKPINKTLPFENTAIHVIPDEDEAVTMVSLHDLCRILKRNDMINGKAMELCASSTRYPVYTNGKLFWFISVSDIFVLLKHVRKENKLVAKTCDKLEKWVSGLPIGRSVQPGKTRLKKTDKNIEKDNKVEPCQQLQELTELDANMLYFDFNGKRYRNATEMGRRSGENPRKWLLKAETQKFRFALVAQGKSESLESQIITKRGQQGGTFLVDDLAVEYARFLDPAIAIKSNKIINDLDIYGIVVSKNKENNSNQNQGNKPPEKSPEIQFNQLVEYSQFNLPQTRSEALMLAAQLAQQIERDKPKVEYYNRMIEDRNHFTTYFIASELDVSVVNLYKFLVNERIVKYEKKQYTVYASHQALQCEIDYLFTFKNGKTYPCGKGKRWTKAGREFIIELYKQKNPQKILIIE